MIHMNWMPLSVEHLVKCVIMSTNRKGISRPQWRIPQGAFVRSGLSLQADFVQL